MGQLKSKHKISKNNSFEIDNCCELDRFDEVESNYRYFIDLKLHPKLITLIQQIRYYQNGFDKLNLVNIYVHWNIKFYNILHSNLITNSLANLMIPINTHIPNLKNSDNMIYYSAITYLIINIYNYRDEYQKKILRHSKSDDFYEIIVNDINSKLENHTINIKIIDVLEVILIYVSITGTNIEFMLYNKYSFIFLNGYMILRFIENTKIDLLTRILKYCNLYINIVICNIPFMISE